MPRNKSERSDNFAAPFPSNLRKLMEERGVSQGKISEVTGKTRQTVSQYANGISEPPFETLVKIADFFDVSTDYLLGRTQEQDRKPSAVDDLGLSNKAVSRILSMKEGNKSALEGLNCLLENRGFKFICENLIDLKTTYSEERKFLQTLKEDSTSGTLPFLSKSEQAGIHIDELVSRYESEIVKSHPEAYRRIRVVSGGNYANLLSGEIMTAFEAIIHGESGYYEYAKEAYDIDT